MTPGEISIRKQRRQPDGQHPVPTECCVKQHPRGDMGLAAQDHHPSRGASGQGTGIGILRED